MRQYIVDAFTKEIFHGNPAAVCVMDTWISDELMQKIAVENNLSETAFVVKENNYHIRWFTPGKEVDLCGHATLASAYVLSRFYDTEAGSFAFDSLSGELIVKKAGELLKMDFPSRDPRETEFTTEMQDAVNGLNAKAYISRDIMLVLDREEDVINFIPDYSKIMEVTEGMGLFITAPSKDYDFVSRTFFPKIKVNEDPVCGSAHCNLIPYWSKRLGKDKMTAFQASPRGGIVYCENKGERVIISGNAALYSESEINIR